jgi:uncharacterized protein YbjT (DUF2867 family)
MKVILFGATGMVGQGVLRECLLDPTVNLVLSIGRSRTGTDHPEFREIIHRDFMQYSAIETQLTGFDACFFCLGVSSTGMKREDYERITYGYTLAAAETLVRLNPQMTFIYVSGAGTDSSERGWSNWARVKGRTENALLRLPFKAAYMFRPGFIETKNDIQSKTVSYRLFYTLTRPVMPLLRLTFPNFILTTEELGRAMIAVAKDGAPKRILESRDILALSRIIQPTDKQPHR